MTRLWYTKQNEKGLEVGYQNEPGQFVKDSTWQPDEGPAALDRSVVLMELEALCRRPMHHVPARRRRYLDDGHFHDFVTWIEKFCLSAGYSSADVMDALLIVYERGHLEGKK